MTGFDMSKKSIRPEGSAASYSRSEDGRKRRSLSDMKKDDAYPKLCKVFLARSQYVSEYHVSALQFYYGKSFTEAAQALHITQQGKLAYVGTYTHEVEQTKRGMVAAVLAKKGQPPMSFVCERVAPEI